MTGPHLDTLAGAIGDDYDRQHASLSRAAAMLPGWMAQRLDGSDIYSAHPDELGHAAGLVREREQQARALAARQREHAHPDAPVIVYEPSTGFGLTRQNGAKETLS